MTKAPVGEWTTQEDIESRRKGWLEKGKNRLWSAPQGLKRNSIAELGTLREEMCELSCMVERLERALPLEGESGSSGSGEWA